MYIFGYDIPLVELLFVMLILLLIALIFLVILIIKFRREQKDMARILKMIYDADVAELLKHQKIKRVK